MWYSLERLQEDLSALEPSIKGVMVIDLRSKVIRSLMAKLDYLAYNQGEETNIGRLCRGIQASLEKLKLSKRIFDETLICSICTDSLRSRVKLSCGHSFCKTCLMLWFAKDKSKSDCVNSQCPLCRQPFNRKIRKILRSHIGYNHEFERCRKQRFIEMQQQDLEDELLANELENMVVIGGNADPEPVELFPGN